MDVHPPHSPMHSWKDFWIHLGTITIGLLIAISLEQSVEALHHRHQRRQLEEDVREEIQGDLAKNRITLQHLGQTRQYLVELKASVDAQRAGKPVRPLSPTDPRRGSVIIVSSMSAWEGAKESGAVALLPSREIRLYNRFVFQLESRHLALIEYEKSAEVMQSFEERFIDSPGSFDLANESVAPSIGGMSPDDLREYSNAIAAVIKSLDRVVSRERWVDAENQALVDGAQDEDDLVKRTLHLLSIDSGSNASTSMSKAP
jgi:hypothetical protein